MRQMHEVAIMEEKYNFCYNDCPFRKLRFVDRYIVNDCQKSDTEQPPDSCPKEVNHGDPD